jgi:hypothetical protein
MPTYRKKVGENLKKVFNKKKGDSDAALHPKSPLIVP